jgi:hypothetical protein
MSSVSNLNDLETAITKIAYRQEVNKPLSQYALYSELLEVYKIKDIYSKNTLKMNMLIIMRNLPILYDGFKVINDNDTLSIVLLDEDIPFSYDNIEVNTSSSSKSDESMPLEAEVIRYIVDNDICNKMPKGDFNGNTLLHYLVKLGDLERINTILIKNPELSFFDKNKDDVSPIDLNTDIKVTNLVFKLLLTKIETQEKDINEQKVVIKNNSNDIKSIHNTLLFFILINLVILAINLGVYFKIYLN